ncbi:MAG: transglycosylase SLT domain-containing protein [Desulfobacteraceae bacterium]|nr:transglycosylase SLT domain-containing protein [Desulfobacteraceae bacterium]
MHPSVTFCDEPVPMADQQVKERFEKEMMLSLWDRPQVILWLKRSARYMNVIERVLTEDQLPADLKYVAIAESALRPHVGSRKGAIGFWQLLPETGRKYGLTINDRIDDRRNIYASTRAAATYLKTLHAKFKSWALAVAAYNMGEQGLMAEMMEQGVDNYYDLYLPLETQRFVFRIISAKLILSDPAAFGFHLSPLEAYPPVTSDHVAVNCFRETPIRLIAAAAETKFKTIKDMNPQFRGHYLAVGSHTLLIPKGAGKEFAERYEKLLTEYGKERSDRIYIVSEGDNLSTIAAKFNVPLAAIIIWNRMDISRPIHPGDRLVIYPGGPHTGVVEE